MMMSKKIREALDHLREQIDDGYVDVSTAHEKLEVQIIDNALSMYEDWLEDAENRYETREEAETALRKEADYE